jgi:MoxR-like ATPase
MPRAKQPEIEEVDGDPVNAILEVEKALQSSLVNRTQQIRAMILGVAAEHNVLLIGPPGTAKTMMGTQFSSFVDSDDFIFFKTQMMKGSVPEQLFGPLNVKKMREDAVWEYNTKDMLPDAHIAIIEEVYRAPEMLLSSMLSVLNERIYHNGHRVQKCPLICALGTTNFVTEGEEVEAFKDRWLIQCNVDALKAADDRIAMFELSLGMRKTERALITLRDIRALHELRRQVTIAPELLTLFEQLIADLSRRGSSVKITDRRAAHALSLVQANAVLSNRSEANEDDVIAAEFAFTVKGNPKDESEFAASYSATIGNFQAIKEESSQNKVLEERYEKYLAAFDSEMPKEKARKLQALCQTMLSAMSNRQGSFVSSANKAKYDKIYADTDALLRSTAELLT